MVHQTEMAFHFTAIADFVEKRRRGVLISLGILAAAGLAWGLMNSAQSEKSFKARDQLHQAITANDESALKKVAETFKGTRSGFDAWMELAKRASFRSDWATAVDLYDHAAQQAPSKLDGSVAVLGLASCLQALGKFEEASKRLTNHLSKSDPAVLPELLLVLGHVKASLKDADGARSSLNRIVSEFGDTEYAQKARQALAELPRTGA